MLAPRPPRLPPARRAVPEMAVRYQQPASISTGHVLPAKVATLEIEAVPVDAEPALRFTVVYALREYLAILSDHLPAGLRNWERARAKAPRDGLSWSSRIALRVLLPIMGTPVFLMKKRRMPVCEFVIDASGIERRTRDGTLQVPWSDVVKVHRYTQAYLIDKGRGGLPIPYRCLTGEQRAGFERLLLSRFGDDTPI